MNRKWKGENKKRPHDSSGFQSLSVYLWMSKASPDSAKTSKFFIKAPVAVLMSGTIWRRIQEEMQTNGLRWNNWWHYLTDVINKRSYKIVRTLQPIKEHAHPTTLTWLKKTATSDFNCTVPTHLLLTSFILEALNAGVRMLLTLFQRSFLNISRQSLMGLVSKRKFFTKSTQTTHMHYS